MIQFNLTQRTKPRWSVSGPVPFYIRGIVSPPHSVALALGDLCRFDLLPRLLRPLLSLFVIAMLFARRAAESIAVILNIAIRESWKNGKGVYENRTEWRRVLLGGIS